MLLTRKQEDNIYSQLVDIFETKYTEATNIESNYIHNDYNYFMICTCDEKVRTYKVTFKISPSSHLLKRSIIVTEQK